MADDIENKDEDLKKEVSSDSEIDTNDSSEKEEDGDNVISFKKKKEEKKADEAADRIWELSKNIDQLLYESIDGGVSVYDMAGVVANRLGEICGAIHRATGTSVLKAVIAIVEKQESKSK